MNDQKRIIIPCRLAYLQCWTPKKVFGKERYSVVALVNKEDQKTVEYLQNVIDELKQKAIDKWGGRLSGVRSPLHDGDAEKPEMPVFHNSYYLNAKSKEPPEICDQKLHIITDPEKIYSGCYANVSLIFYLYNFANTKGVGVWLGNIQLVRDGERIVFRIKAQEEFQPLTSNEMLDEFKAL